MPSLGPLPAMSSSRRDRPSVATSFSPTFDEVDEGALDDLLGSDSEDVTTRLHKSQSRVRERKPTGTGAVSGGSSKGTDEVKTRRPNVRNEWDDGNAEEKTLPRDASDDDLPAASGFRPASRPLPSRHQRPLPTKKGGGGPSSSTSLADSMDAALFGIRPSSAMSSTTPISATVKDSDFSLTTPLDQLNPTHSRSRSRTLNVDRDHPTLSSPNSFHEFDPSDVTSQRQQHRQPMGSPALKDSPPLTRRSGLSIDDETATQLTSAQRHQRQGSTDGGSGEGGVAEDSLSDRRAKYRELMRKKREERSINIKVNPPIPTESQSPPVSSSPPSRSGHPSTSPPADDPWSALDDPMASISEGPSAAEKVARSFAAVAGPEVKGELPMPPQIAVIPSTIAVDGGGRVRRPMAGRRAALASETEELRPTTAPIAAPVALASSTVPRPTTALPPFTPTPTSSSTPEFILTAQTWTQWLGINPLTESSLLPIAHKAASLPLPAHFTSTPGGWVDQRTGRHLTSHPALNRWLRRVEQKRLALKYNVEADDTEDEDEDAFWKEADELEQSNPPKALLKSVDPIPPPISSLSSSSLQLSPFPPTSGVTGSIGSFPAPVGMPPAVTAPPVSEAPPVVSGSLAESIAHQRQALIAHYSGYIQQLQSALSSQSTHLHSLTALHSRQLDEALAHAHRMAQSERDRDTTLWEQRLKGLEATHRREVEGLRESLYDSKVMQGLTATITGNVKSIEVLAGQVSNDTKARDAEREKAWQVREQLLNQREEAFEHDRRRLEERTTAVQAQVDASAQREDSWRKEKATFQGDVSAQQQRLHLLTVQLQNEKELLLSEKKKFLSDQERWDRIRLQREDELTAAKEVVDREKRQVEVEVTEGRAARAEVMQKLDVEREDLRLQRDLLSLRRRKIEADETQMSDSMTALQLHHRSLQVREEQLGELGRQAYEHSQRLLKEKKAMEEDRVRWAEQVVPATPHGGGWVQGMSWTPTMLFAPFLVGRENQGVGTLSAADVKLLEVETAIMLQRTKGDQRGLLPLSKSGDSKWEVGAPEAWG